jgi:hypothetical protein
MARRDLLGRHCLRNGGGYPSLLADLLDEADGRERSQDADLLARVRFRALQIEGIEPKRIALTDQQLFPTGEGRKFDRAEWAI